MALFVHLEQLLIFILKCVFKQKNIQMLKKYEELRASNNYKKKSEDRGSVIHHKKIKQH